MHWHLFIDAAIYKIDFLKFNLLSNGLIEKFWDALWLGIGPFLCLTVRSERSPLNTLWGVLEAKAS